MPETTTVTRSAAPFRWILVFETAAIIATTTPAQADAPSINVPLAPYVYTPQGPPALSAPFDAKSLANSATWAFAANSVTKWADLPVDWDGEGSTAPSRVLVERAVDFLNAARQRVLSAPRPFIDGPGEIGLRWKTDQSFGSVAFMDDGNIVAYVQRPGRVAPFKLDAPYNGVAPAELLDELSRIA